MNKLFILLALIGIQTSLPAENIEASLPEQNAEIILMDADTIEALSVDLLIDDWASLLSKIDVRKAHR